MRKRLETALNECLALLDQGHALEECLQRFPAHRDELEPLLETAALVKRSFRRPEPSEIALTRARNHFMAEVARRQQLEQTPRGKRASRFSFAWSPGLATALLTLIILVGVLGGGGMVSANSIPGDPLYGVKRASESVRLMLTFGHEAKADLEQAFAERRIQEVMQALEQHREARVEFAGVVSSVAGGNIVISGVVVRVGQDDVPQIGAEVAVVAQTRSDGSIEASQVTVKATPIKPPPEPTMTSQNAPTLDPTDKPAAKPTETRQPSPTPTMEIPATVIVEITPTISITATMAVSPTATAIQTPSVTPTSTPTMTPPPPPHDVTVRIEGRIDEITGEYWRVGGQQVFISSTSINQERAKAQVGGHAVVNAVKKADGRLVATSIVVLSGPDQPPEPKEFNGAISAISGDTWVVAGRTVQVGSATIEGEPRVGSVAHVKADQYADGRLVARHITVESVQEQIVRFGGIVQSFSESSWVVAGQRVAVNSDTKISGDPQVGAIAEVEAVVHVDGSRVARKISIMAPPEPTQEPAPTATVVPTEPDPTPETGETTEPDSESTPELEPTAKPSPEPTSTPGMIPPAPTPQPSADDGEEGTQSASGETGDTATAPETGLPSATEALSEPSSGAENSETAEGE